MERFPRGMAAVLTMGAVLAFAVATGGCMTIRSNARYIYQDGEFGVIGIPQNSPYGKKDYRKQALDLMADHFPDGFEIVRAEEVIEGQRVLDRSRKLDVATDPSISALNQSLSLGKLAQSMSMQQKDSLSILESRIIYRRKTAASPPGANGFAASAKDTPELYRDPHDVARSLEKIELAELKRKKDAAAMAEKTSDPAVKQASKEEVK